MKITEIVWLLGVFMCLKGCMCYLCHKKSLEFCNIMMFCSPAGKCRNYDRKCASPHMSALRRPSTRHSTVTTTSSSSNSCALRHSSTRASCTATSTKCAPRHWLSSSRLTAPQVMWSRSVDPRTYSQIAIITPGTIYIWCADFTYFYFICLSIYIYIYLFQSRTIVDNSFIEN